MQTIANQTVGRPGFQLARLLFLLFDSAGKLLQVQPVIDGTCSSGILGTACSAWG